MHLSCNHFIKQAKELLLILIIIIIIMLRYRRQDEIGTPYCVTYDFETEKDGLRYSKGTMIQPNRVHCKLKELTVYINKEIELKTKGVNNDTINSWVFMGY